MSFYNTVKEPERLLFGTDERILLDNQSYDTSELRERQEGASVHYRGWHARTRIGTLRNEDGARAIRL